MMPDIVVATVDHFGRVGLSVVVETAGIIVVCRYLSVDMYPKHPQGILLCAHRPKEVELDLIPA